MLVLFRSDLDCATSVVAQLNQRCACEVVDVFSLHESIRSAFPEFTADPSVHAHLFSPYALFVDRAALDAMGRVAAPVFDVAANPRYRQHVLQWAPDIATRSEEPTSELQSLMRLSYAVFCLKQKN